MKIFYDSESQDITLFSVAALMILTLTSLAVAFLYLDAFLDLHGLHTCLSTYSMFYYVLNTVIFALIGSLGLVIGAILGLLLCGASAALLIWSAGLGVIEMFKMCHLLSTQRNEDIHEPNPQSK